MNTRFKGFLSKCSEMFNLWNRFGLEIAPSDSSTYDVCCATLSGTYVKWTGF